MADEKEKDKTPGNTNNEVALDLMKFIAVTTGYGKGASGAGFNSKSASQGTDAYAEALLELYKRCRAVVAEKDK
jgi:hypothetical protein